MLLRNRKLEPELNGTRFQLLKEAEMEEGGDSCETRVKIAPSKELIGTEDCPSDLVVRRSRNLW